MLNPDQPLEITFQRGNKQFETTIVPEAAGTSQMGYVGWVADQPNTVTDLEAGMPAEKAGVKEGDLIVALGANPGPAIAAMIQALKHIKDKPAELAVLRHRETMTIRIQPVLA